MRVALIVVFASVRTVADVCGSNSPEFVFSCAYVRVAMLPVEIQIPQVHVVSYVEVCPAKFPFTGFNPSTGCGAQLGWKGLRKCDHSFDI